MSADVQHHQMIPLVADLHLKVAAPAASAPTEPSEWFKYDAHAPYPHTLGPFWFEVLFRAIGGGATVELHVDADVGTGELDPVELTDAVAAEVRPFERNPLQFYRRSEFSGGEFAAASF
jgi:hypothetical protein